MGLEPSVAAIWAELRPDALEFLTRPDRIGERDARHERLLAPLLSVEGEHRVNRALDMPDVADLSAALRERRQSRGMSSDELDASDLLWIMEKITEAIEDAPDVSFLAATATATSSELSVGIQHIHFQAWFRPYLKVMGEMLSEFKKTGGLIQQMQDRINSLETSVRELRVQESIRKNEVQALNHRLHKIESARATAESEARLAEMARDALETRLARLEGVMTLHESHSKTPITKLKDGTVQTGEDGNE